MPSNKSKRRIRLKSEIIKQSSALQLGTGVVDQKVLDLIDLSNLASWFELTAFDRVRRKTERVTEVLWKMEAALPELPDDASDDESRRDRDRASEITTLIMRAEAAKNAAFGGIMQRADLRFPPARSHPFNMRRDGHPLSSYLTAFDLVPSIRQVRRTLWRLAIAAKQGRTSVELPIANPPRRTTFILHPNGTVGIHEDPAVIVLNDVIKDAISAITDVRRLRICNLRQRRQGNRLCGQIFWAERRDAFQCCDKHRDLARKQKEREVYEPTRRRKERPGAPYTDRELSELSRAVRDIANESEKFTTQR